MSWRCLFPLFLCALHWLPLAAEPSAFPPLASVAVPACSVRPGTRAVRSGLVQMGEVSVSITAEAVRESGNACTRNAALWVTRGDVSQQFELRAAAGVLAINDVSAKAASVLLTARDAQNALRFAILSLTDGSPKWIALTDLLGRTSCAYSFEPQGFVDPTHIAVGASPQYPGPNCTGGSFVYIIEPETRRVKAASSADVVRRAFSVSDSAPACETDPDRSAACYTTRARLGLAKDAAGLVLWPVNSLHLMSVPEGMVPGEIRSRVTSTTRVYASVLVCPLVAPVKPRPFACVGSAKDLRPETDSKGVRARILSPAFVVLGAPH